ncbi:MAG: hypothetical protein PHY54_18430 [Methylococcales bacterium]|nr:hypothetical protein [Methylococcales bacterium]
MRIKTRLEKLERQNCFEGLLAVIVISPKESREQAIQRWRKKNSFAKLPERAFIFEWDEAKSLVSKFTQLGS